MRAGMRRPKTVATAVLNSSLLQSPELLSHALEREVRWIHSGRTGRVHYDDLRRDWLVSRTRCDGPLSHQDPLPFRINAQADDLVHAVRARSTRGQHEQVLQLRR